MNALLNDLGLSAEQWRPVIGFPDYEVSDRGNVRRCKPSLRNHRPKQLTLRASADGYVRVSLSKDGLDRTRLVHRIVLEAFGGGCPDGCETDHIDGCRSNNRHDNLRWIPKSQNLAIRRMACGSKNSNAKLNEASAAEARRMVEEEGRSRRSVAKHFGVSSPVIDRIANGTAWRGAR